jgi:hypothetical protein
MQHLFKVLCDLEALAGCTPKSGGESEEWATAIRAAEDNLACYSVALQGKALYSALYGAYTVTLNELKRVLQSSSQAGQPNHADGFQEVRSRKRLSTAEAARTPKKVAVQTPGPQVPTKNFYAPLRATNMETDAPATEPIPPEAATQGKTGRPPPIVLTSTVNLIQLQKQLKGVAKDSFEFRITRNGTRVVTKDMVDYQAVKHYFDNQSLPYFTFSPKSQKPIKAVIRHLPHNTPAEDIAEGLGDIGFDVISVKQMSSVRRSPEGPTNITLPLFLVTLPRTTKSSELFKLSSLCHISIRVEAYKSQNSLTQCFNCQKFGHVWANCKQPPRCLWCGGGHLHKDCPEKGNTPSTPACCNCQLSDGEKAHSGYYRGCKHAREEMRKKKPQGTPKTTSGRVFSSNPVKTHLSFAAALRGQAETKPQQEAAVISTNTSGAKADEQATGKSVQNPNVNSDYLEILRAFSVAQHIMAELKGSASEEDRFVSIAKIIFNLMKQNVK